MAYYFSTGRFVLSPPVLLLFLNTFTKVCGFLRFLKFRHSCKIAFTHCLSLISHIFSILWPYIRNPVSSSSAVLLRFLLWSMEPPSFPNVMQNPYLFIYCLPAERLLIILLRWLKAPVDLSAQPFTVYIQNSLHHSMTPSKIISYMYVTLFLL